MKNNTFCTHYSHIRSSAIFSYQEVNPCGVDVFHDALILIVCCFPVLIYLASLCFQYIFVEELRKMKHYIQDEYKHNRWCQYCNLKFSIADLTSIFASLQTPGVVACACNPATRRLGLEGRLRTGALHWAVLWEGVGQPGIMAKPKSWSLCRKRRPGLRQEGHPA